MYLTPQAKSKLSNTIRILRERLLIDFHNAIDSAYRLSIPLKTAGLSEELHMKRQRLEQWLDEQSRSETKAKKDEVRQRYLKTAEKLAAATFLNRLIVIKQMEAHGLIKPAVITGGWQSSGYREFRDFAPELLKDETEGYGTLLQLLYDELSLELPGLFGDVGVTALFPIPASTLRAVIEALNQPELQDAWLDDTTLGWVYQYWNDPEREALDAKLNGGGKVEPHEIASKTQMFTERYMVEWLLHNSLGQMWLAMCQKHRWIAEVEADGTLQRLETRRKEWREKREKGEVSLDALMPIESESEELWKYWVPQPLTDDAVEYAPDSVREIKILDPACGSGHFLVIAFGLLFALYREEARHRGESWNDVSIVESILENNLYGIDIDPNAVQIAAAALILKARLICPKASPRFLNLVASNLQLGSLPENDPALVELRREVTETTGIPEKLTNQIVQSLKGADYLGSLLKVDTAVDEAILNYEQSLVKPIQGSLFYSVYAEDEANDLASRSQKMKDSLLEKLEKFLSRCTNGDDLGLRLRGEQLAAGIRFIRMIQENYYDLVIGNPPYQGTSKMVDAAYITKHYPMGKADLYAAFLERGLQLVKVGGISAMLTMRNWMFIQQFTKIREYLIDNFDLRILGDVDRGAFDEVPNEVLAAVMSVFQKVPPSGNISIAMQPTPLDDNSYDRQRTKRKRAAVLAQVGRFEFERDRFNAIKEKPLIYWWDDDFLQRYAGTIKLRECVEMWQGVATTNNTRFLRNIWEVQRQDLWLVRAKGKIRIQPELESVKWVPYVKGAKGRAWFDSISDVIEWDRAGLKLGVCQDFYRIKHPALQIKDAQMFFRIAIAYSTIGSYFSARLHRFRSIFDVSGSSVFPIGNEELLCCLLNSKISSKILSSLNPTVNFQVGDIKRLPLFPIESAEEIFNELENAFTEHEKARETSVEFKQPAPSAWNYAQEWAQKAVDREPGTPLPDYQPIYEQPAATNFVSYSIGVALGRFEKTEGRGQRAEGKEGGKVQENRLPHGILYLSAYSERDNLQHPASQIIRETWQQHGATIAKSKTLREWLRLNFFKEVHLEMYANRPIYFPLSSTKKNFVAFISIHRWQNNTLQDLLAEYLIPELNHLEGELSDLIDARHQGDKKNQTKAEERYSKIQQLHTELKTFIDLVRQTAEQGAPPANPKDTAREVDARFKMDLDDGVMINSAALWSLLEPQWTQPKKWWSELCNAQGKKDYDWAHLAARYFPSRVDEKCQKDPSLAVAHGVFWKYHPAKAYEWELRLKDEISSDFTIDEQNSDEYRQTFEEENPELVNDLIEKEEKRRERKRKKEEDDNDTPLLDQIDNSGEEEE
ncbi:MULTISPECIES: BREX-6 system adenine-specific DNA-methyltransferase PglX [unclassified Tychonema]|uniref:BREX-6 system adenine-specific DNA-methyltransferase PglX n=1 Tax=unclassified Tychonema TaxID=2642144 RepID=UPI0018811D85|nr:MULTISPECIES: BREX-6 system adenine-specific DNA-methyltransferase PglX [unclassified Tychonema]MBE9093664.1 BREX-6 system adenine-specific DNA-methyltransferase PglX [Tychonema sp. LEGE 07203]MBE9119520.1 BREX-6 system adenine-specific DNA-methyltransferase PglX [Tychonema sp. LEGE 07199]MBE9130708.1 BREX-6 system adenine-specific DNA-methyltransferase PglX [Tychonema sp. LEGE 07196]